MPLAEVLALVLPALDPALAGPDTAKRIDQLGALLPALPLGGFECRLEDGDPQVDVQQAVLAAEGDPAVLAAFIASEELAGATPLSPAWRAARRLCEEWSRADSPLSQSLRVLALEFDAPSTLPNRLSQLTPSLFAGVGDPSKPSEASWAAAATVLPFLAQDRDPAPLQAALARCRAAGAEEVRVDHVGVMLGRESAGCRIHLAGVRVEVMGALLQSVGWPGDPVFVQRLAGKLLEFVDHVLLCLDLAETVRPRLGLECVFSPRPETDARLPDLLAHLVELGLCSPAKQAALLRWPGLVLPSESVTPWPAMLIARELRQAPTRFGAVARRWNHLKLVHEPGQPLRAKGYLYFGPLWLQASGQAAPAPASPHSGVVSSTRNTRKPVGLRRVAIAAAIEAATGFLIRSRNQAGLWRDFFARAWPHEPGRLMAETSDEWVSAYVGWALAGCPEGNGASAARAIWDLLCERRTSEDGWGYNAQIPPDADSTAWALRLAESLGIGETERTHNCRRLLLRQMRADGGVACYRSDAADELARAYRFPGPFDGWCQPHDSITATAAVLQLGPRPVDYLLSRQRSDGSWRDYWWDDDEVTTTRAVEALLKDARGESRKAALRAAAWASGRIGASGAVCSVAQGGESCFATALCIEAMARAHVACFQSPSLERAVIWLVSQQREDGSFPSSAWLLAPPPFVMDRHAFPGPVSRSRDHDAIYTTATALAAFQLVYSLGPGVLGGE